MMAAIDWLRGVWQGISSLARETAFRGRVTHIGHLVSGNSVTLVLGLVSVALTTRTLGPEGYGILAMVIAYAQAIERFVSFQSWQPLIRYGAELTDDASRRDKMALFKFGFVLDVAAAATGWLIAVVLALVGSSLFSWTNETLRIVLLYCSVLLFAIKGTPAAVLRLAGSFRSLAYGQIISVSARLILCTIAFFLNAGILGFILVWTTTQVLGSLVLMSLAFRELRREGLQGFLTAPLRGISARFRGLWRFTWSANLSLTVWSSAQQFDTLLVGALVDPASAGFFHLSKRVGRVAEQIGMQVQAVIYPEIAGLWAKGAHPAFQRVVVQVLGFLWGFGVLAFAFLLLTAETLLSWWAGPKFVPAAPLLQVQMIAVTLFMCGSVMRTALLSMGRDILIFVFVLAATAPFYVVALLLVPRIGAIGANIAHIVLGIIWVVGLGVQMRKSIRYEQAQSTKGPSLAGAVEPGTAESH